MSLFALRVTNMLCSIALLFSGSANSLRITREYYLSYSCKFNLYYYPFDTQVCKMEFAVQGKTDKYIILQKDGKGVELLCKFYFHKLEYSDTPKSLFKTVIFILIDIWL